MTEDTFSHVVAQFVFESVFDKTYKKTGATSEDSAQPTYPCSLISLRS